MNIITTNNSKLGGMIAQVNMPYGVTCRDDAPCKNGCYAAKGKFSYANVKQAHLDRYQLYKENPTAFFGMIDAELTMVRYKYFRWHSSGDIPDVQYLDLMCKLARKHKETRFLCFTKKDFLVNGYFYLKKRKPSNLIIVLSNWQKWHPYNPFGFPESFVDFGDGHVPADAYRCSGNCGECEGTHCWYMEKGDKVVFARH